MRRVTPITRGQLHEPLGPARRLPSSAHLVNKRAGQPATPIGGYVCASTIEPQSHQVIALAATGQLGMAAAGQIPLAVVIPTRQLSQMGH